MVQNILKGYLRRLTNLSGSNRSLYMLRLGAENFIDLHDFDFISNEPSFRIIAQLIERQSSIPLCEVVDPRAKSGNGLSRKLTKLKRIDHFIFEERGAQDLYVGWPFVRGKFMDGTAVRCPLMFFPVQLTVAGNQWSLQPRKGANFTLNKSFLQAYAYFNGVKLEEDLVERVFDDFDRDSKIFRTALYELFKESNVELNFNQDNFADRLYAFQSFTKENFDQTHQDGVLKLFPEAVLGIFPQAGSYLVPDYVTLLENDKVQALEDFFTSRTIDKDALGFSPNAEAYQFLSKVKEEQTFTPFAVDSFQENAIKAVKKGNSVVVQGPPGTGKSQMICNLIADYIARGKNVLVVCQKRAALDVVYQRIRELDLEAFVALTHDFKGDRKSIYEQIAAQIGRIDDFEARNNSLDTIQVERSFLQLSRKIDLLSEELEEFKFALFDESEAGISVKELYLTSNPAEDAVNLRREYRDFRISDLASFRRTLSTYITYAERFQSEDYAWARRKSFAGFGATALNEIKRCLNEIPAFQDTISQKTDELIHQPVTIREATDILDKKTKVEEFLAILRDKMAFQYFKLLVEKDADPDLLWISNQERLIMQCYKGSGIELSLPASELGRFQEVLERTIKARKGLFSWLRWKLFSKDKVFVTRVLVANGLKNDRDGFNELIAKIDSRLNYEHNLSKVKAQKWVESYPASNRKVEVENWFYFQKQAISAKIIYTSLRSFKEFLPVTKLFYEELRDRFHALLEIYQEIPEKLADWTQYLTITQIHEVADHSPKIDLLQKALVQDFDSLCDFDHIRESLISTEQALIDKLCDHSTPIQHDKIMRLFENSIRLAWIDHIEAKYPILRAVSSQKLAQIQKELQEAVLEKMKISNEILLMKAKERTYNNLEYNRLNNRVTYRDLLHQVTKKRKVWPLRKLIQQFPEEVFNLVPCWLASPEAASAIFPMEEIFDLVIFDEASQCFAEKGIPAMYRGRQVVITGDDKQLQPSDLYRVRWEGEQEEEIAELEVDSLLDLAKKYLMQLHLRGHYRSKSLPLIDFSNRHFYENKLRLLPDYQEGEVEAPPIEYIKVAGIWENNTNAVEADEVVGIVQKLVEKQPGLSLGVVTFNAQQRELIMDKLDALAQQNALVIPESLFVKNIENVQGDEKDVIIFSTAYAPDAKGKMAMKFGSLNTAGGENRLNVAITRAREKIIIVSSIWPQQLRVEGLMNEGPKLLQKYLAYALSVSNGETVPTITGEASHQATWYLSEKLKQLISKGQQEVEVSHQMPFADLALHVDAKAKGLLLTDDQMYHDAVSVKDSYVYKPLSLSQKNWKFLGLYSRQWWLDKEAVNDKLRKFLHAIK